MPSVKDEQDSTEIIKPADFGILYIFLFFAINFKQFLLHIWRDFEIFSLVMPSYQRIFILAPKPHIIQFVKHFFLIDESKQSGWIVEGFVILLVLSVYFVEIKFF